MMIDLPKKAWKSYRKSIILCVAAIFVLQSSAYSSYNPAIPNNFEKSRIINGKFDDVWGKLINWFAVRGIRIETVEKASGLIQVQTTVDKLNLRRYPVTSCGKISNREVSYKPDLRLNVVVNRIDANKVKVDVNIFLEKWKEQDRYNKAKYHNISCYSTGYAENEILNALSDEYVAYQPPQVTSYGAGTGGAGNRSFFFIGGGTVDMNTTNFFDVHISDWQNYGTGSAEGRVALAIAKADASSTPFMLSVGGGGYLQGKEDIIILEGMAAFGSSSYTAFAVGAGYDFAIAYDDNFRIGFLPKFNILYQTIDFGNVRLLPGKRAPVITKQGTFYEGDEIKAVQYGVGAQGLLTARYNFTKKWGLQFNVGYMFSVFLGDLEVEVKDPKSEDNKTRLTIDFKDKSVVEPELGSTINPGFVPKANITGLNAYLTFVFHMN